MSASRYCSASRPRGCRARALARRWRAAPTLHRPVRPAAASRPSARASLAAMPAWNFSQMRGTPKKTVRLHFLEVVGDLLDRLGEVDDVADRRPAPWMVNICSAMCDSGRYDSSDVGRAAVDRSPRDARPSTPGCRARASRPWAGRWCRRCRSASPSCSGSSASRRCVEVARRRRASPRRQELLPAQHQRVVDARRAAHHHDVAQARQAGALLLRPSRHCSAFSRGRPATRRGGRCTAPRPASRWCRCRPARRRPTWRRGGRSPTRGG